RFGGTRAAGPAPGLAPAPGPGIIFDSCDPSCCLASQNSQPNICTILSTMPLFGGVPPTVTTRVRTFCPFESIVPQTGQGLRTPKLSRVRFAILLASN